MGFAPSPTFEQLAKKITGVEFYTVDVSDQIEIATWIVKTQELRSVRYPYRLPLSMTGRTDWFSVAYVPNI